MREWHLKSGYIITETNDNFIKNKLTKSKTEENNLAILMCQEFMYDENTRMSLSKSYLENIGLEELSYLCCSSQAHYNILGKENDSILEESIILPFVKFTKNGNKYINNYNLETLIDLVFKELVKETPSLKREKVASSYQEIISFIDEKMKYDDSWNEARARGDTFEPHNISGLQDKYNFK